MPVTVGDIIAVLGECAPENLAAQWDNVGLLCGCPASAVERVMLALDVTPGVAGQAAGEKAQMIISHHPLIFHEIKKLAETDWRSRLLAKLIRDNVAVYAAHTNLDFCAGGVSDALAQKLGLSDVAVLRKSGHCLLRKIAVFVPDQYADRVMAAMAREGAGHIGQYSDCSFRVKGTGAFRPLAGTHPFAGREGEMSSVKETRIETVAPAEKLAAVLKAMLAAHPYEEAAYDVYELANDRTGVWGAGRIGALKEAMTVRDFALMAKSALRLDYALYADAGRPVRKVAVCGGAGGDLVQDALAGGADILVTGDLGHHAAQEAKLAGLSLLDAGHQGTERPVLPFLADKIAASAKGRKIKILIAEEEPSLLML
ncbi:MAG: Nif3-like dinuclear metal center hexameric protein [Acidaminococcales bacterium]|jgi:dinuclear metal center YbgI/SA1388 family protein|nr:Nif3-like dinuclear metal center hexameric protein [Acidaminococcales bacterium]